MPKEDFAAINEQGRVVKSLANRVTGGQRRADQNARLGISLRGFADFVDRLQRLPDEPVAFDQIARRITGQEKLWKNDQIGSVCGRCLQCLLDLCQITGKIPDGWVQLCHGYFHGILHSD